MKIFNKQKNSGFTLIETMVAVFILTVALTSLLNLNASSIFNARYAKNEIIADYLLQEPIDYIRNDRDTIAFQHNGGRDWNSFINKYGYAGSNFCFSANGCELEPALGTIKNCTTLHTGNFGTIDCKLLNYDNTALNDDFYTYGTPSGYMQSNFKRQIKMSINPSNADELDIKITLEWLNGNLVRSRSLQTTLMKWQ